MRTIIRNILISMPLVFMTIGANAQTAMLRAFKPTCDSLNVLIQERQGISSPKIGLNSIMKRGNTLDFYFTQSLCDCSWYEGDPEWFRKQLDDLFPEEYRNYTIGEIYTKKLTLDKLVTPRLGYDGKPAATVNRT